MSPADQLRTAAERLRDVGRDCFLHASGDAALYLVAVSRLKQFGVYEPHVALMLADWLESEADQAEHFAHLPRWDQPQTQTAALALAEYVSASVREGRNG